MNFLRFFLPEASHSVHRPFGEFEAKLLRRVVRAGSKDAPLPVPPTNNPGVRVIPEFISAAEESDVIVSALQLMDLQGISHVTEDHKALYNRQMDHLAHPPDVNMKRLTGRDEDVDWMPEKQKPAPWGYGDDFRLERVPGPLAGIAARIREAPDFTLGALRDITINLRHQGFFRLDPHVDPISDGGNVFILGFCSPTVMSLTPVGGAMGSLMNQRAVSTKSWAAKEDIDVLMKPRTLCHLHGDARQLLNHGIRMGVDAAQLKKQGVNVPDNASLYDWWGGMTSPVQRSPMRLSVVLAFADVDEIF